MIEALAAQVDRWSRSQRQGNEGGRLNLIAGQGDAVEPHPAVAALKKQAILQPVCARQTKLADERCFAAATTGWKRHFAGIEETCARRTITVDAGVADEVNRKLSALPTADVTAVTGVPEKRLSTELESVQAISGRNAVLNG